MVFTWSGARNRSSMGDERIYKYVSTVTYKVCITHSKRIHVFGMRESGHSLKLRVVSQYALWVYCNVLYFNLYCDKLPPLACIMDSTTDWASLFGWHWKHVNIVQSADWCFIRSLGRWCFYSNSWRNLRRASTSKRIDKVSESWTLRCVPPAAKFDVMLIWKSCFVIERLRW